VSGAGDERLGRLRIQSAREEVTCFGHDRPSRHQWLRDAVQRAPAAAWCWSRAFARARKKLCVTDEGGPVKVGRVQGPGGSVPQASWPW
jgi:hypothetical protein